MDDAVGSESGWRTVLASDHVREARSRRADARCVIHKPYAFSWSNSLCFTRPFGQNQRSYM
jgi:hypothetical protein